VVHSLEDGVLLKHLDKKLQNYDRFMVLQLKHQQQVLSLHALLLEFLLAQHIQSLALLLESDLRNEQVLYDGGSPEILFGHGFLRYQ